MPTVGLDCQIILDGSGYWIEPDSYQLIRQRIRRSVSNRVPGGAVGAGERYVDLGPGKREWAMTLACYQAMRDYAGAFLSQTGQQQRDALHASYNKVNTTLPFTDPAGVAWQVHFDHLQETIADLRAQPDGQLQYLCHVVLVEA